MWCIIGRIDISGNDEILVAGRARSIRCTWENGIIGTLSWCLEGLYTIPLASSENSSLVTLTLDPSTTGLNGTNFICRANGYHGDSYESMTTVIVKGIINFFSVKETEAVLKCLLYCRYECGNYSQLHVSS